MAFNVAATASTLLHASVLLGLVGWLQNPDAGAIPEPSEAVTVEMVASATLEALQPKQASEPAPSPEATALVQGKAEASELSVPKAEPPPEPLPVPEPVEPALAEAPEAKEKVSRSPREGEPAETPAPPPPVEAAEVVHELPKAKAPDEKDVQAKRKRIEKVERKARARKGGTTSKARSGKGSGSSRATASQGAILRYKNVVRARVAANKPSSECTRGATVVVNFAVTQSGGLAHVRVVRSSGDPAYRQQAAASVRRAAPFPRPPAGATYLQRLFTIPFYCN